MIGIHYNVQITYERTLQDNKFNLSGAFQISIVMKI